MALFCGCSGLDCAVFSLKSRGQGTGLTTVSVRRVGSIVRLEAGRQICWWSGSRYLFCGVTFISAGGIGVGTHGVWASLMGRWSRCDLSRTVKRPSWLLRVEGCSEWTRDAAGISERPSGGGWCWGRSWESRKDPFGTGVGVWFGWAPLLIVERLFTKETLSKTKIE